ncbi:UNVERIFIED_CONTAM: Transcription factor bye1 [Siphonaria sp. JEL0065]|nr:Transcription factor bye1 [Siphonaria sp. JEL0065]
MGKSDEAPATSGDPASDALNSQVQTQTHGRLSQRVRHRPNYAIAALADIDDFSVGTTATSTTTTGTTKAKKATAKKEELIEQDEEEDAVIRCVCLQKDENGHNWVQCDRCKVWQHQNCIGLEGKRLSKHINYFCERCRPTDHPYFKLLAKQQSSTTRPVSASKSATTPAAKKRSTMNSLDAVNDSFAANSASSDDCELVQDASNLDLPDEPLADNHDAVSPKSSFAQKRKGNAGKKRGRDRDLGKGADSAGEFEDLSFKKRTKQEPTDKKSDSADSSTITLTSTSAIVGKPKGRGKKTASAGTDAESNRQPSPSVAAASLRGSPSSGSPLVPASDLFLPITTKADSQQSLPNVSYTPTQLSDSTSSSMCVDPPDLVPQQFHLQPQEQPQPQIPRQTAITTVPKPKSKAAKSVAAKLAKANSNNAGNPSPNASISNALIDGAYMDPTKPRTTSHRISISDIKRRILSVSQYVHTLETSDPFIQDSKRLPCQCGSVVATAAGSRNRSPGSIISTKYHSEGSSSSSSSSESECSLLTPPLSTTSPSPVFVVTNGKMYNNGSDIENAPTNMSLNNNHTTKEPATTLTTTTNSFLKAADGVCDLCSGSLLQQQEGMDGEESSFVILQRLREKLNAFSSEFGN